jgi:hypothetical protein
MTSLRTSHVFYSIKSISRIILPRRDIDGWMDASIDQLLFHGESCGDQ